MQQSVIYRYRKIQNRARTLNLVKSIVRIMFYGLLIILILQVQSFKHTVAATQRKITEIISEKDTQIQKQRADYEFKIKVITSTPAPRRLTQEEAKQMISVIFPQQIKDRFAKVTMQCENKSLQTDKRSINRPGFGYDLGLAQINSKYHKDRVEKMFGMPFDVAMSMPVLNYIYAAFLVEHSGLTPWVCDRLV